METKKKFINNHKKFKNGKKDKDTNKVTTSTTSTSTYSSSIFKLFSKKKRLSQEITVDEQQQTNENTTTAATTETTATITTAQTASSTEATPIQIVNKSSSSLNNSNGGSSSNNSSSSSIGDIIENSNSPTTATPTSPNHHIFPKIFKINKEGVKNNSPQNDLKIDDYFNLTTTQIPNSNLLHRLDSRMVGILGEADINKCKEVIPGDQHFIIGYSLVLVTFNTIVQPKMIKTFTSSPVALLISDKSAFIVLFDTRSQTIQQVESCDLTEIKDIHSGYMSNTITSNQLNNNNNNNFNNNNNNNNNNTTQNNLMEDGVSISPRNSKKNLGSFVLRIVKIKGSWVLMGYSPSDSPEVQREKIKTIEATVKSITDKAKMQHKIESRLSNSERTHIQTAYFQPTPDIIVEGEIYFNLKKFSFIQIINQPTNNTTSSLSTLPQKPKQEDFSFSIDLISIFECKYSTSTVIENFWELKLVSQGEKSNNHYYLYLPALDIESITKTIARMITESQDIALLGYDDSVSLDVIDELNLSTLNLNNDQQQQQQQNNNSVNTTTNHHQIQQQNANQNQQQQQIQQQKQHFHNIMNNSIDKNLLCDNTVYRNLKKIQTKHETIDLSTNNKDLNENNFYFMDQDDDDEDNINNNDVNNNNNNRNNNNNNNYNNNHEIFQINSNLDNNKPNHIPTSIHFQGKSDLLKPDDMLWLQSFLPTRFNDEPFELVYSTLKHGISIRTFFSRVSQRSPCILVIKDDRRTIFGAYTSDPWQQEQKVHYGSGETFLFKLNGGTNGTEKKKFSWTRKNDNFMYSNGCISLGTGEKSAAFGLWIDEDLYYGSSVKSTTFDNEVLSYSSEFKVLEIEVWSSVSSKVNDSQRKTLNAREFFSPQYLSNWK